MNDPNTITAAYKTVETFAGIVKKQLSLKNGKLARNNGLEIVAPFDDRDVYLLVERQLAHILFQSDARARERFVREFIGSIEKLADKYNLRDTDRSQVQAVVERIIDILESRRIESLWGMIYPGSYSRSRDRIQMDAMRQLPRAHHSFFDLMACLDAELDVPAGPLDRFRPFFATALKKVERRGFTATLALSRWLVSRLVDEILRRDQEGYRAVPEGSDPEAGGDKTVPGPDESTDADTKEPQEKEPQEKGAPKPSARQRLMALQAMAHEFGQLDQGLENHYNDYGIGKGSELASRDAARTALELNLNNEAQMEQVLQESERRMGAFLDDIQKQLVTPPDHDSWLRKDTLCHLEFVNVEPDDVDAEPLSFVHLTPADKAYVERLRSKFFRILGRRATHLEETGSELDVHAYIESRTTGLHIPFFRTEARGRGFRLMLLIDRSESMKLGSRIVQAERAARMILDALDFPFVEVSVWGFQSPDDGQVTITRFSPLLETFNTTKSPVHGDTPLHIALKVAVREMTIGSDAKHLVVLTDGAPRFYGLNRRAIPENALRLFVREEVQLARRRGINVTTLLIGDRTNDGRILFDVPRKHLQFMFGSERYWKCVDEQRLGEDLMRAVTDSFLTYLNN